jgi:hypothetical protein
MTIRKLGRNEKCHCGSGRKYKNCHLDQDGIPAIVQEMENGGTVTINVAGTTLHVVEETETQIPLWLYLHAANFAKQAAERPGHAATMMTLFLTAAASEALVNRLLGPLVPEIEWSRMEKGRPGEKWSALAAKLGVSNALAVGKRPLQGLAWVHTLRNELMHFKHERHNVSVRRELPKEIKAGKLVFDLDNPGTAMTESGEGPDLEAALDPNQAQVYFGYLNETLHLALDAYQEDRFHIVERLRAVIAQAAEGKFQ